VNTFYAHLVNIFSKFVLKSETPQRSGATL
jgi:hypothetical protein